jgi:Flp pilus assembly protein TadG
LRFVDNRRGVFTVLYALLAIPILGLLFGGIDYSRALSAQSQF